MAVAIRMVDQFPGTARRAPRLLHLASERVTARELIARRLQADAALALASDTASDAEPLMRRDPSVSQVTAIDWPAQTEQACRAFERNGFLMLLDDTQIEDLDQELVVRADSEVVFIKLVQLVGG